MRERRRSARINKHLSLQYFSRKNGSWNRGIIKDISYCGACFVSDEPYIANSIIDLKIKIPPLPEDWIETKAKIVSCEGSDKSICVIRVEFIGFKENQKNIFLNYILALAPKSILSETETKQEGLKKPLTVKYSHLDENNQLQWSHAKVLCINTMGIILNSSGQLKSNTTINIMAIFPEHPSETIQMRARVISSILTPGGTYRTELEFLELDKNKMQIIRHFTQH
ncbi:MAG: PilZ domain-containing protein [Candidatus Omnitrophota bacterium]|nr:PilZ domain-containing protein [Candidatus Omnitrophota bacterium]